MKQNSIEPATDTEESRLQSLPCHVIWHDIYKHLSGGDALNMAMTCSSMYAQLFSHHPSFSSLYGPAHAIARCFMDMVKSVREHPAGMIGWYFSREWNSRHGIALSRGDCIFIMKLPRARNMFMVSTDYSNVEVMRSKVTTERCALEWFRKHIVDHWPHVEVRSHCMYKHKRRRECVANLQKRMVTLLNALVASAVHDNTLCNLQKNNLNGRMFGEMP